MDDQLFVMFSIEHFLAIAVLLICLMATYIFKGRLLNDSRKSILFERSFAILLLSMEIAYHLVLLNRNVWSVSASLPLHLCSLSLFFSIYLLWTGSSRLNDFVFFAGLGGALQAVLTPSVVENFPDFRFIHFFFIHSGIILTAFYLYMIKGYRPTFKGIIRTFVILNILFPIITAVNFLVEGNYMFLREKPASGSLLDFLGPYPWYILSLEAVAFLMFTALWLIFRKKGGSHRNSAVQLIESSNNAQNLSA